MVHPFNEYCLMLLNNGGGGIHGTILGSKRIEVKTMFYT